MSNQERTTLIFKRCPELRPDHIMSWISDVRIAFDERGWSDYIEYPPFPIGTSTPAPTPVATTEKEKEENNQDPPPPTPTLTLDAATVRKAKAFLLTGIQYEHRYGLEEYATAAEVLHAIATRYGSTPEDVVRLEESIMNLRKPRDKSLDDHISDFSTLISKVLATGSAWQLARRNMSFVHTLTNAVDEEEAKLWMEFYTFTGKDMFQMRPDLLFSRARTWMENHIKPKLIKPFAQSIAGSSEAHVAATRSENQRNTRFRSESRNNNSNSNAQSGSQSGNPQSSSNNNSKFKYDASKWCWFHRKRGHHTRDCEAAKKDPEYLEFLELASNNDAPRAAAIRAYKSSALPSAPLWLYDSCATHHMTDRKHLIHNYRPFEHPINVHGVGANSQSLQALGSGSVILQSVECINTHTITNVLYVPDLNESIVSKICARRDGLKTTMDADEDHILVYPANNFVMKSSSVNGMDSFPSVTALPIDAKTYAASLEYASSDESASTTDNDSMPELVDDTSPLCASTPASADNALTPPLPPSLPPCKFDKNTLWHNRFGHVSDKRISSALHLKISKPAFCEPCIIGKIKNAPYKGIDDKSTIPLHRVFIDHCGKISPVSAGGCIYLLTLRDQATGYSWAYPVPDKSAKTVIAILKTWLPNVERQTGHKLKIIRTDDAQEFKSVNEQYLQPLGIEHESTAGYASSSNGVVERAHQAIFDIARPMLKLSGLPTTFWAEAVRHACYLMNRLPSSSNKENHSPYYLWFGHHPVVKHIRTFGCIAYHRIPEEQLGASSKADDRGVKCVMIGHLGTRMRRLYNLATGTMLKSRTTEFCEDQFPLLSDFKHPQQQSPLHIEFLEYGDDEINFESDVDIPVTPPPDSTNGDADNVDNDGFTTVPLRKHSTDPIASQSTPMPPLNIKSSNPFDILSDPDDSEDSDDDDELPPNAPTIAQPQTQPIPAQPTQPPATDPTTTDPLSISTSSPEALQSRQSSPIASPTDHHSTNALNASPTLSDTLPSTATAAELGSPTTESSHLHSGQPSQPPSVSGQASSAPNDNISGTASTQNIIVGQSRTGRYLKLSDKGKKSLEYVNTTRRGRGRGSTSSRGPSAPSQNPSVNAVSTSSSSEPRSYYESQLREDADKWEAAAIEEINSLDDLGVWEIVPRPTNRKVLNSRFIFKIKDKHTQNPRYKARLVAQGHEEVPGLDYTDTFAPVVKASSVRAIIAHAAANQRELRQFDVKNAYANSDTNTISYIEFPKGFEDPNYPRHQYCLRILKALYGRHASAMEWHNKACDEAKSIGFTPCESDPCVFIHKERYIILGIYVDDFLVSAPSKLDSDWLLSRFNERFETRDLGPAQRFLGVDIYRPEPNGPIFMNQGVYVRQILNEFGMSSCNPAFTPLLTSIKLHKRKEDEKPGDIDWYRKLIGKFMHLLYTRPDIASAVSKLAQFLSDPSDIHVQQAKHLLRYLRKTQDLGIEYGTDPNSKINGYCDASFDDDPDTSHSTSGQIFIYNGGTISHQSKKQPIVALSTMESEFIAISEATKEALFLKSLFEELHLGKQQTIPLHTDSQPAYDHITKNLHHNRTKHIHRRFNFAREANSNGDIELRRIPASEQAADILTKILPWVEHGNALNLLNMHSINIPI